MIILIGVPLLFAAATAIAYLVGWRAHRRLSIREAIVARDAYLLRGEKDKAAGAEQVRHQLEFERW